MFDWWSLSSHINTTILGQLISDCVYWKITHCFIVAFRLFLKHNQFLWLIQISTSLTFALKNCSQFKEAVHTWSLNVFFFWSDGYLILKRAGVNASETHLRCINPIDQTTSGGGHILWTILYVRYNSTTFNATPHMKIWDVCSALLDFFISFYFWLVINC